MSEEATRKASKALGWKLTAGSLAPCGDCAIGKGRQKNQCLNLSSHGTIGWVFASSQPHRALPCCSCPAYGAFTDSYRAEAYGSLSDPTLLHLLSNFYKIRSHRLHSCARKPCHCGYSFPEPAETSLTTPFDQVGTSYRPFATISCFIRLSPHTMSEAIRIEFRFPVCPPSLSTNYPG
jgi:hypothetical protein